MSNLKLTNEELSFLEDVLKPMLDVYVKESEEFIDGDYHAQKEMSLTLDILYQVKEQLSEKTLAPDVIDRLEFHDGGDGIEYEVWEDPETGKLYKLEIEIVRNFDGAQEVKSLHEAKFGGS